MGNNLDKIDRGLTALAALKSSQAPANFAAG